MSLLDSSETEFIIESVGSRNFHNIVKFWCRSCRQSCYGFDEVFGNLIGENEFHCKTCGAHWSLLEPIYFMHTELKKAGEFGDGFSCNLIGPILDGVMGMTVREYLNLIELGGVEILFNITEKFMKESFFKGKFDRAQLKLVSMRLKDNCALTFKQWITKQEEYNRPETYELINREFDEDDGFVGSDE